MSTDLNSPRPLPTFVPGQPWSHLETLHLIDAYEDRWLALNRGHLRAPQWDAVAADVAARCALSNAPFTKSPVQCRHKIEKLRKRYRSDRQRPSRTPWPYFDRMDRLERGHLAVHFHHQPLQRFPEGKGGDPRVFIHSKSIDVPRSMNLPKGEIFGKGDDEGEGERGGMVSALASVARRIGDGLMRLEGARMEMMRQLERDWMEMERKRMQMVVESERYLVETIASAFSGPVKRVKMSHGEEFGQFQQKGGL